MDRVAAVNVLLRSADGTQRLFVDPKCRELIKDFEKVRRKQDLAGNTLDDLDKSDPARSHACVTGNTPVFTVRGLRLISELVGAQGYVYGWSAVENRIAIAKYDVAAMTCASADVYRVLLDDGSTLRATSNHRFLMRDGLYRLLADLQVGDSLMPLYWCVMNGYLKVRRMQRPGYADWEWAHRLVGMDVLGVVSDKYHRHLHHKDHDKLNNDPENLELKTISAHHCEHMEDPIRLEQARKVMDAIRPRGDNHHARQPGYWTPERRAAVSGIWDDERREKAAEQNRAVFAAHGNPNDRPGVKAKQSGKMKARWNNPIERARLIEAMRAKRTAGIADNHKIVSIEPVGNESVYCLKTSLGNFATDSIVIGNSDALGYLIWGEFPLAPTGGPRSSVIA